MLNYIGIYVERSIHRSFRTSDIIITAVKKYLGPAVPIEPSEHTTLTLLYTYEYFVYNKCKVFYLKLMKPMH
ncbi:MAG: hypothetical protein PHT69_01445 [Bacteroidales bacterium]|nr:hypothetical protein [Bacteroidales bacterium]